MTADRPDEYQLLKELPMRRALVTLSNRARIITKRLKTVANFDQYPSKEKNFSFSCRYGPIPLETPGRQGETVGYLGLADLINTTQPRLPIEGNMKTGRQGAFYLCGVNATMDFSWTRTGANGDGGPVNALPAGDLFDSVIEQNGGGQTLQNLMDLEWSAGGTQRQNAPSMSWEIDLYDKRRGRSISGGRVPAEMFMVGTLGFRKVGGMAYEAGGARGMRWDVDSEIEPRLYVTQARVPFATTDAIFNAARVAFWANVVFRGYVAMEDSHV